MCKRDHTCDVVVVGARIAGSTVAALLGERGLRVLLVERVRFPSTTISTHFFRGDGLVAVLDKLSILDEVLALGPPPLRREWSFGFGTPGPDEGPPQEPGEAGFSLSVRRGPLDDLLFHRAARTEGVEVAQPATVTGLLREDGRVVGARLRDREAEYECGAGSSSAPTGATHWSPARSRRPPSTRSKPCARSTTATCRDGARPTVERPTPPSSR